MQISEESDDVIGVSTKIVQQSITNISRKLILNNKPGTRTVRHKRNKMTPIVSLPCQQLCRGSYLIKTKITRFYLKQGSSISNNLMERVKTIWNLVCSEQDPLSHFKRLQMGLFGFSQKGTHRHSKHIM